MPVLPAQVEDDDDSGGGKKIKMNMPTTKKWSRPTTAITTACRYSCDACGMRFGQLKCIEAFDKPSYMLTFVSLMNKLRWGKVQWIVLVAPLQEENNGSPARLLLFVFVRM
jgi:hypothetical protein